MNHLKSGERERKRKRERGEQERCTELKRPPSGRGLKNKTTAVTQNHYTCDTFRAINL